MTTTTEPDRSEPIPYLKHLIELQADNVVGAIGHGNDETADYYKARMEGMLVAWSLLMGGNLNALMDAELNAAAVRAGLRSAVKPATLTP